MLEKKGKVIGNIEVRIRGHILSLDEVLLVTNNIKELRVG